MVDKIVVKSETPFSDVYDANGSARALKITYVLSNGERVTPAGFTARAHGVSIARSAKRFITDSTWPHTTDAQRAKAASRAKAAGATRFCLHKEVPAAR